MANEILRSKIARHNLKYWEVSKRVGICNSTFSVWLREELTGKRKERVNRALKELIEERQGITKS